MDVMAATSHTYPQKVKHVTTQESQPSNLKIFFL